MSTVPLLEIKGLTKIFPGVVALDGVDLTIQKGEVHVLLGENGAGKSTLIKSIMGIEQPNEGTFLWNGEPFQNSCVADAHRMGIATVYQELSNIPCLSVVENMFVGNEIIKKGRRHIIDWKKEREMAKKYLEKVGSTVSPDAICETLGMGQKQLVEIAKALMHNAKLIIMDEPTSSLSRREIDDLLNLMNGLREEGVSILFITHKLDEAQHIGDVVSILKDGHRVGETMPMRDVNEDEIVRMLVGRDLSDKYPSRSVDIGEVVLSVKNLSGKGFTDINFDLRRGELLGVFGLVGAGRTEAMRAIFGADPKLSGEIVLNGKALQIKSPADAIREGIVLISENRKEEGLVLIHNVVENATLSTLPSFKSHLLLNHKKRRSVTTEYGRMMKLRPLQIDKNAMNFSGGNQQKIVIEKWVIANAEVYIFDEPTKGVDIGAKTEIYMIMNSLLEKGASIIMVSSEMQEILGVSDRIMVMYDGKQTGIIPNDERATHENLMILGTGGKIS